MRLGEALRATSARKSGQQIMSPGLLRAGDIGRELRPELVDHERRAAGDRAVRAPCSCKSAVGLVAGVAALDLGVRAREARSRAARSDATPAPSCQQLDAQLALVETDAEQQLAARRAKRRST